MLRNLTVRDMFVVIDMLKKVSTSADLTELIISGSKKNQSNEDDFVKIGILIVARLYELLKEDTIAWFADLVGKSKDELLDSNPTTILSIIDELTGEETKDFFSQAFALYKKITQLGQ